MRKLLSLLTLILSIPAIAIAQGGNTTVTAHILDPTGAIYTQSQVNITYIEPNTVGKIPLLNGSTFQKQYTIFATDSFGFFTISLPDNGLIDSGSGVSGDAWSFRVIYNNRSTSFVYVTPINCALNIPATCTNNTMDISSQLQAVAALLPATAGGGGALVVKNIPCASTLNFQVAGTFPTSANTAFTIPLTCNVTSTSITQASGGTIQRGTIIQFTLPQDNIGGRIFTWPANFIDQPVIQAAANATTNASFWYDGTSWHAQTFPASGGGGGGNPAGVSGDAQGNNGVGGFNALKINDNGSLIKVNEDMAAIGPNPSVDIRAYNSRSVNTAAVPQVPGITASTNATLPNITLSSASTFQNGDGVSIFGAGAVQSMTTPVAPTVTPSIANLGTGIGSLATGVATVVSGPTGATTYNYQVVARDKQGGFTAAGPVGTTTVGQTLGFRTITITSIAKSGLLNTVLTSSAHGLAVGAMVQIFATSDDTDFGGWFQIATVPDTTHFTYFNGQDSANGAATSATGGTVNYWNCNHLSWTQVTGAFAYYIYGRTGGSLTLIGVSKPSGTVVDLTWDDYGSPMMDGFVAPYYIPTTPPGSPANDILTTTILSGAGTTSPTLANAAGTTVSGATILFDNAPTFLAAANASHTSGTLYIPVGGFVINSYLTLPAISISQAGSLTLNDTIQVVGGTKWFGDLVPQSDGPPQFAYAGQRPILTARATPGIYGAGIADSVFRGLGFPQSTNGAISIILDQANHDTFEWLNFPTIQGSTDYMGIGLMLRGSVNIFNNTMRNISITASQSKNTATPMIYCEFCGFMQIFNVSASGRAFLFQDAVDLHIQGGREQAGNAPFVILGGSGGTLSIKDFELDTMGNPLVAGITNAISPSPERYSLTVDNAGQPSGGLPNVSGSPFYSVIGSAGQNTSSTSISGGRVQTSGANGGVRANGTSNIGYLMPLPAAPNVVVGGSGSCVSNCVAVGTYFYAVSALDVSGNETGRTLTTSATTDGTQTITISWTPSPGQVATRRFRGPSANNTNSDTAPGTGIGGSSYLDTNLIAYSNTNFNLGATSSSLSSLGLSAPTFTLTNSTFKDTQTGTFTANRTTTWPDLSGTVAKLPTYTLNGIPYGNGTNFNITNAGGAGAQCLTETNGGTPTFGACSGAAATAWSSLSNPASDLSLNMGANNTLFTSGVLTGTRNAWEFLDGNSTSTGSLFNLHTGATSTLKPLTITAQGTANGVQMNTSGILAPLGTGGITANAWTPSLTANQLLVGNAGTISSLAGTLGGTNPVMTFTSASIGNVPLALNTPSSPTADILDLNINSVKTSWVDNLGIWHAPSYTANGSGALVLTGTESTPCPTPSGGNDILCIGNSTTHTIQSSLNGAAYKDIPQFSNSGPTAHGVCLVGAIFPQLNCTSAGATGQAFISGGSVVDGSFGVLGAVGGGTGNATNTLHGVGLGQGTLALNFSTAGTSGQPFISGGAGADGAYGSLNLAGGASIVNGVLPLGNVSPNIVTVTGAITPNDCVKWSASTIVTDSGGTCGGAGGSARLDQLLGATVSNTINSTIFPQFWQWALTGSTTAFKFGEQTAATGASNVILQASTLNTSTAVPFQADSNGAGYQLSSAGLFKPIGSGAIATPGAAHNLVVSQAGSSAVTYVPPITAGKVLIDNGPGNDPSFQDPIISQAYVNLWTAQDVTVTRTSAAIRNPIFSQTGTLELTWASITGSPATCTLQIQGVDSVGNSLNNGSTFSVTPANGTTSQTFTAAATLQTSAQVKAIFACVTYPTTGTLTLDFTPIPNVNVTNTIPVTVASLPLPTGASTSAKQPALGIAGTASSDVITVQGIASMTPLAVTASAGTNLNTSALALDATLTGGGTKAVPEPSTSSGDAVSACNILSAASTNSTSCKGSAGNFYGYEIYNTTTTIYYLRLYNSSSAPTCSSATGFIRTIPIPPAGAAGQAGGAISNQVFPVNYGTGIGYCITGGSSSTDNTNAATGVFGELRYK